MARINIEERFWFDPRLAALQDKLGRAQAIGEVFIFWRLAQEQFVQGKLVTEQQFKLSGLSEALLEVGFAERYPEGIYAKGSERHFQWLLERKEAGKLGGSRKSEAKTLAAQQREQRKRSIQQNQTLSTSNHKQPQPSTSTSTSTSVKETTIAQNEFARVYELYPRKLGKKRGFAKLKTIFRLPENIVKFEIAVKNYTQHCAFEKKEPRYIMHFSTFVNCWEDWVESVKFEKPKPQPLFNQTDPALLKDLDQPFPETNKNVLELIRKAKRDL